jgi:hypothetical protein
MVALAGLAVAIASGVIVPLALHDGGNGHVGGAGETGRRESALRMAGLVVHNGPNDRDPSLDVRLHNVGTARSVLTRARITVKQVEAFPVCYSASALRVTGKYSATLPARPGVVDVPLHQQIGPDAADRFSLVVGASEQSLGLDRDDPRTFVYRLGIAISDDSGAAPLNGGTALVGVPHVPDYLGTFWPKEFESKTQAQLASNFGPSFPYEKLMPCWRDNTPRLRQILSQPGTRSSELADVRRQLAETVEVPRP